VAELEQAIQSRIDNWNRNLRPFVWTKTADEILDTIASYCRRINDSRPCGVFSKLGFTARCRSPGLDPASWFARFGIARRPVVRAEEETVVITRIWRGWTHSDQADRYEQHYRWEVMATLRQVPGFRGARLLRRTVGEETEFMSLTFFDDLAAIRGFAGSDYETAVVAGEARKVLIRFDERVCHYQTIFEA
jgi:heme-degrading monooxygenase HmoA